MNHLAIKHKCMVPWARPSVSIQITNVSAQRKRSIKVISIFELSLLVYSGSSIRSFQKWKCFFIPRPSVPAAKSFSLSFGFDFHMRFILLFKAFRNGPFCLFKCFHSSLKGKRETNRLKNVLNNMQNAFKINFHLTSYSAIAPTSPLLIEVFINLNPLMLKIKEKFFWNDLEISY